MPNVVFKSVESFSSEDPVCCWMKRKQSDFWFTHSHMPLSELPRFQPVGQGSAQMEVSRRRGKECFHYSASGKADDH